MPSIASGIPLIDFTGFGDGHTDRAQIIGTQLHAACRDVGFAYLLNTEMSQRSIDEMFDNSKAFFELPLEVKESARHPPGGVHHRGYSGIGLENVSQLVFDENEIAALRKTSPDYKESFDMGNKNAPETPNIWFDDAHLPGFQRKAMSFFDECRLVQLQVLRALSLGFELAVDYLEGYHTDSANQLRLLHYPSAPYKDFESGSKGRINAHTDYGICTLLFQDDVGGLEVEDPNVPGKFIPAPPIKGAVVLNIGDTMRRWSNDTLKSTFHRVRATPNLADENGFTKERFSIPYFTCSNVETVLDALPGTWSASNPKKHEAASPKEYIERRMNATYN